MLPHCTHGTDARHTMVGHVSAECGAALRACRCALARRYANACRCGRRCSRPDRGAPSSWDAIKCRSPCIQSVTACWMTLRCLRTVYEQPPVYAPNPHHGVHTRLAASLAPLPREVDPSPNGARSQPALLGQFQPCLLRAHEQQDGCLIVLTLRSHRTQRG